MKNEKAIQDLKSSLVSYATALAEDAKLESVEVIFPGSVLPESKREIYAACEVAKLASATADCARRLAAALEGSEMVFSQLHGWRIA